MGRFSDRYPDDYSLTTVLFQLLYRVRSSQSCL